MKSLTIGGALCLGLILAFMHLYLLDGIEGELYSFAFREDTLYSNGYTDNGFRRISAGNREPEVVKTLKTPLGEAWTYNCGSTTPGGIVGLVGNSVIHVHVFSGESKCFKGIFEGMTREDLLRELGEPIKKIFTYSKSRHDQSFRVRTITLVRGVVVDKKSYFYID